MMKIDHPEDVERAASVRIGMCGCPALHIVLVDDAGEAFASCAFTPESWRTLAAEAQRLLAAAASGDAIGRCEGHG